ncbi:MAG: DUF1080 domain-containing protein [Vicinamibacteraceae bacterium]
MPSRFLILTFVLAAAVPPVVSAQTPAAAPPAPPQGDPKLTEVWEPVPKVVTPSPDQAAPTPAPSDAIVLFDGKNLDEWVNVKGQTPATWVVQDGTFVVHKPSGNIETKRKFTNYQLHIEWKIPVGITGTNQARGNSGLFLASTGTGDSGYELQILDSFENKTYVNGQAGSIYKQGAPLVNAMRKPGEWNVYDVLWTAPVFNADGTVKTPARVTVLHNGVLVQNGFEPKGGTVYIGQPSYKAHGASSLKLQSHGDPSAPISFRNIWIRELP